MKQYSFGEFVLKASCSKSLISNILGALKKVSDDNEVYSYQYENNTPAYDLLFSSQIKINFRGMELNGWGSGESQDESNFKASVELLERVLALNHKPRSFLNYSSFFSKGHSIQDIQIKYSKSKNWLWKTTSGLALHSKKKDAIEGAISELIERHVLMKAHLLNLSGFKVDSTDFVKSYKLPKDFNLSFYCWRGPLDYIVTTSLLDTPIGPFFGFGSSQDQATSINKAFIEVNPKIIYAFEKFYLKSEDAISPKHMEKSLDLFSDNEKDGTSLQLIDTEVIADSFFYSMNSFKDFPDFKNINLVAVRAINPLLQPMIKGILKSSDINPACMDQDIKLPDYEHFVG